MFYWRYSGIKTNGITPQRLQVYLGTYIYNILTGNDAEIHLCILLASKFSLVNARILVTSIERTLKIGAAHSSARNFLPNYSSDRSKGELKFIPTKVLMNILGLKNVFIFRRALFFVITGYNLHLIGKWSRKTCFSFWEVLSKLACLFKDQQFSVSWKLSSLSRTNAFHSRTGRFRWTVLTIVGAIVLFISAPW